MSRCFSHVILVIVLTLSCVSCRAQPEQPKSIAATNDNLTFRSRVLEAAFQIELSKSNTDLAFVSRTVPIDSWQLSDPEIRKNLLAAVADRVIRQPGEILGLNQARLDDVYGSILVEAQWATGTALTESERAELDAAEKVLFSDSKSRTSTEAYSKYLQVKADLQKQIDEEAKVDLEKLEPGKAEELQRKTRNLKRQLEDMNKSFSFGKHELIVGRQNQQNPAVYAGEVARRFEARRREGAVTSYPGFERLLATDANWSVVTLQFGNDATNVPVITAMTRDGSSQEFYKAIGPGTLRFEVARFVVSRPWLDVSLFQNPYWRRTDSKIVSTGTTNASEAEILPFLASEVYLVKNVSLDVPITSELRERLAASLRQSKRVSVAGITLAGDTWSPENGDVFYLRPALTSTGLKLESVQFLGWRLLRVPSSPRPKEGLLWPNPK